MNERHDSIERRAYALWESRGRQNGAAETDWLEAERRLAQERQRIIAAPAMREIGDDEAISIEPSVNLIDSKGERQG